MNTTKRIVFGGMFVALLIGTQFALSAVSGVELVTVLFLSYCLYFGVLDGVAVATAFTLIRCLIFGFFPNILILYLIYYNLFALCFGLLGHKLCEKNGVWKYVFLTVLAVISTVVFTMLDNLISPLFFGYTAEQMQFYFAMSMSTLLPHVICTAVSVACLLPGLLTVYRRLSFAKQ